MTKQISQILIDSQKTRKQIVGSFWKIQDGKIEGYCGLGALYCEGGLVKINKEVNEETSDAKYSASTTVSQQELIEQLSGKSDLIKNNLECPSCVAGENLPEGYQTYDKSIPRLLYRISEYIIHMNDYHEMTFEEIGLALKEIGY